MGKPNSYRKLFTKTIETDRGCWEWQGGFSKSGYGKVSYMDKSWRAHRLMFFFCYGFAPDMVLHHCDNRACINPVHLYEGNHKQNMNDMKVRNRAFKPKGTKHSQNRFSNQDIINMRNLYEDGFGLDMLSVKYQTHREYVRQIVQRKRWKHI